MEASSAINIKVKTMDSHFVELTVMPSNSVVDVKKLLHEVGRAHQKTGITIDKQRIVFRGRKLNDEETVTSIGLEEGFVLHLIAKLEHTPAPAEQAPNEQPVVGRESSPNSPARQPGSEVVEEEVLGEIAEQEILAGILRTLSMKALPRRQLS